MDLKESGYFRLEHFKAFLELTKMSKKNIYLRLISVLVF